ncbi:MAG: hypothetical protein PSV46_05420 [Reyranella sp.]|nr:hypothetical protein [Reyranella sp.]
MDLSRDRFLDHFVIAFQVHCLKPWKKRAKEPPFHVSTTMYETIRMCGGRMPLKAREFSDLLQPLIEELHRRTPKGERPQPHDLAGGTYDALAAAGVEVTIKPPIHGHGCLSATKEECTP